MAQLRAGAGSVGVRTNFHFEFITTPTSDTPGTTLLLHFATKRYLLGEITEGTQRACIQRGVGLKKVRGLFLAGKTHWNNGGLIGMILTLADVQQSELDEDGVKRPRLDIHAGPMQMHSLACARRFVFRTGMPLSVHEVDIRKTTNDPQPIHEDENIRVWALLTQDASNSIDGVAIDEAQLEIEQEIRQKVVNNMFDSDWRRDQLFQSKLRDIKLPAVVYVRDPETKTLVSYPVLDLDTTSLSPDADVLHRNPWPASTVGELPSASGLSRGAAMSYIVKGHPQRGSFDVKKAVALGMKPGPKFAQLAAGKSVESDDGTGTTITPEMVLSPTRPGRGLALFDVPSVVHLDDLVRNLNKPTDQLLDGVEAAVWITRQDVVGTEQFQSLLHRLGHMRHIISDASLCNDHITQDSSALSSSQLAQIAPNLFSVPRFDNSKAYRPALDKYGAELRSLVANPQVVLAKRGLKVHIEPTFAIDEKEVVSNLDSASFGTVLEPAVQEMLQDDISSYRAATSAFVPGADLQEPEIITLGTGSAAPSKYRNVSAVLLRMPQGMGNYLFDCGEGTLGQLKRLYDAQQLDDVLFNLRAIWISHLHADHHLGTLSVLKAVHKTVGRLAGSESVSLPPPYLLSEINMLDYVDEYQSVLGLPTDALCTPIPCNSFQGLSHRGEPFDIGRQDSYIKEWRTVQVNHCHGAQAVSVTFKNGFKFSYSGDCRPSENFCEIGADSDVLVHEATFDDGMEGDAKAKKHSTTGEAVGVALRMRAKNLILTHFSQRYQKIPVFSSVKMPERVSVEDLLDDVDGEMTNGTVPINDDGADEPPRKLAPTLPSSSWVEADAARELPVAVAFDLMRIKVSQIKDMRRLFPAISKMFEIEEEKREKARCDTAEKVKIEEEKKRAARQESMSKNRKKKDELNRAKQMEANNKTSKKTKRKASGPAVDHAEQTRTTQAQAPGEKSEHAIADGATEPRNVNGRGVNAGENATSSVTATATGVQVGNGAKANRQDDPAQSPHRIGPATEEWEPHDATAVKEHEVQSPAKRRKVG
ncbi:putative tRNA processing endoribonuclease Trz1 [Cladophialophora carrionii]|uniref:ribonuclease Z n=1 Tax=Cladophialophora carrionii TaxID=86049 RepID=A0A1C1CMS2_9EURO|nr:putative tRNA processing endoribonuclease Trz1 [Cladophialophora carrionii]